jgi:hypothetical protein
MSYSNIQSAYATGTAQMVNGRSRLVGIYYTATGAATMTFKSGGAGGTTRLTLASAAGSDSILLSEMGLLFESGIHLTVSGAAISSVTLFFEGGATA